MNKLRTKIYVERNIITGGFDLVVRMGSFLDHTDAMDMASILLTDKGRELFTHFEPEPTRTLH